MSRPVPDGNDTTLLCRCEGVTVAAVESAMTRYAATSLRDVKLATRVGMGFCQGRECRKPFEALARAHGIAVTPDDLAYRPPVRPIRFGDLTGQEGAGAMGVAAPWRMPSPGDAGPVTFWFDGVPYQGRAGEPLALALWSHGVIELGSRPEGSQRGVFCAIGHCFECRVEVDGRDAVRACLVPVREGLVARRLPRDGGLGG